MTDQDWLAERFETHRPHLRRVAYRMLGSLGEAEDTVQDAWLRASRAGSEDVENLAGWLTTIVARLCLNRLRARRSRGEVPLGARLPDPDVGAEPVSDPEREAVIADAVGLAVLVMLEQLTPPERIAFVLHDMFGVPFSEIGAIVERSPATARQLASRARRRVRGAAVPDADLARERRVIDAFLAAVRAGDLEALVAVLAPDVVLRADYGPARAAASGTVRGAARVARQAAAFGRLAEAARPAVVNGSAGLVVVPGRRPYAVLGFTIVRGRIVEIDILADPARLAALDLGALTH